MLTDWLTDEKLEVSAGEGELADNFSGENKGIHQGEIDNQKDSCGSSVALVATQFYL